MSERDKTEVCDYTAYSELSSRTERIGTGDEIFSGGSVVDYQTRVSISDEGS